MSTKQKNNYPLEFKISSAQLAVDSNKSVAQIARDLGINHNTLHGWIDKYSDSNQINQNLLGKFMFSDLVYLKLNESKLLTYKL